MGIGWRGRRELILYAACFSIGGAVAAIDFVLGYTPIGPALAIAVGVLLPMEVLDLMGYVNLV